jgi:hypothetical protein
MVAQTRGGNKRGQTEPRAETNQLQMRVLLWNIRGMGRLARI